MKIKTVSYLGSYGYHEGFPAALGPEFVFLGRSNVGKSSLINALVARKNVARTSNTPGKTRTANFYEVNDALYFVDLPGYGYARVSKTERTRWQGLIARYLDDRDALRGVVHLLDVRHTPTSEDRKTAEALREASRAVCLVFNKIDKIKEREIDTRVAAHLRALPVDDGAAVIPFSAGDGRGRAALWAWIRDCLSH